MSRPFEKSEALLRQVRHYGRNTLKNDNNECHIRAKDSCKDRQKRFESALWIPHPRTGIYYPKGYEWVMDDIPKSAASFKQTYWLRSSDEGTDKPLVDPSDSGIFEHPFLNV